jgi:alpha-amylase
MASVCFYFQVHQPFRLRRYSIFETSSDYFDDQANRDILRKVAEKSYLPANRCMLDLIKRYGGRFRVSYSVSGVVLDQFEMWAPEVLRSFRELAETGCVEFICETYHHSLAFLYSREEFVEQVTAHRRRLKELFEAEPTVFRNTELIYSNEVARAAAELGFNTVLCEGADHLLGYRSPNFLYTPPGRPDIILLLKNYRLSDDIAFRFSDRGWAQWPLTAEKFAGWVNQVNGNGFAVNLFMDYETLGEHQWADTGIFDLMYH